MSVQHFVYIYNIYVKNNTLHLLKNKKINNAHILVLNLINKHQAQNEQNCQN